MLKYFSYKHISLILLVSCSFILVFFEFSWIREQNTSSENPLWVAFILDVSQSMNTRDVWEDSRLEFAKETVYSLLPSLSGYEVSLQIFAGEFQRILPFTGDFEIVTTMSQSLDYKNVIKQWSDIQTALFETLKSFDNRSWSIIVFSDGGEDDIELTRELQSLSKQKNVEIYVVWVGTTQWWYIPTWERFNPYKVYNWERVVSRLERENLKKFSRGIGAKYMEDISDIDLGSLSLKWKTNTDTLIYLMIVLWGIFLYFLYKELYSISTKSVWYIKS